MFMTPAKVQHYPWARNRAVLVHADPARVRSATELRARDSHTPLRLMWRATSVSGSRGRVHEPCRGVARFEMPSGVRRRLTPETGMAALPGSAATALPPVGLTRCFSILRTIVGLWRRCSILHYRPNACSQVGCRRRRAGARQPVLCGVMRGLARGERSRPRPPNPAGVSAAHQCAVLGGRGRVRTRTHPRESEPQCR